jgi:uncharacterized membrane protein YkvA (DUF1232 family)
MGTWNRADGLRRAAFGKEIVGYRFKEWEQRVRRNFWTKLKHFAGQVPFVEDLVAAYYCALDPETPMRVRGILLAALAYFILRWRSRPLTWLQRFPGLGFTDDAAVLTAVFELSSHITPVHRAAAARALGKELPDKGLG